MAERLPVVVCVSGRGTNLQALLEAHRDGRLAVEPVVVFSDRPGAQALERAAAFGVPTVAHPKRRGLSREAYDAEVVERLRPYRPVGAILAGYMRIVSRVFLDAFPRGVVNIHPSLLPAFPGKDAVRRAWEYGVRVIGCTVHLVDEEVDHGPILLQRALPVSPADDAEAWAAQLLPLEHETLVDAVNLWARGGWRIEGRRIVWAS